MSQPQMTEEALTQRLLEKMQQIGFAGLLNTPSVQVAIHTALAPIVQQEWEHAEQMVMARAIEDVTTKLPTALTSASISAQALSDEFPPADFQLYMDVMVRLCLSCLGVKVPAAIVFEVRSHTAMAALSWSLHDGQERTLIRIGCHATIELPWAGRQRYRDEFDIVLRDLILSLRGNKDELLGAYDVLKSLHTALTPVEVPGPPRPVEPPPQVEDMAPVAAVPAPSVEPLPAPPAGPPVEDGQSPNAAETPASAPAPEPPAAAAPGDATQE